MEIEEQKTRKRGRPAGSSTRPEKFTLSLDPDFADWGKRQPGGLSELVRRLLKEAHEKAEAALDAADNQKWEASFAATPEDKLRKMADKVRADYAAGRTKPGGFGGE